MDQGTIIKDVTSLPDWRERLCGLLLSLEPEARRARFHAAVSEETLRNYCARSAPVALILASRGGQVIGSAELHEIDGGLEMAICVAPGERGRGCGRLLALAAVRAAHARGVPRLRAVCEAGNRAMRRLCRVTEGLDEIPA